jgi:hypothetical protein
VELRRSSGCINIAIVKDDERSVPGLSDAELEQLVLEGFEQWTSIDCGSGPPAIQIQSAGIIDVDDVFTCRRMPRLNLDQWMLSTDLPSPQVITATTGTLAATTYPSFVRETGEVFDADVKLNTLWLLIQDEADLHGHLRTVATHEAGHALGLSHSKDEAALMFDSYTVTSDRKPTADDARGLCELFPPGELDCEPLPEIAPALGQRDCDSAYRHYISQPQPGTLDSQSATSCAYCTLGQRHANRWVMAYTALLSLWIWRSRARWTPSSKH